MSFTSASRSRLAWLLMAALILAVPGCGGCTPDTVEARKQKEKELKELEEKKKKEKPKEDITFEPLQLEPSESTKERAEGNFARRGHWVSAVQPMKANNADVKIDITSAISNNVGDPFEIEESGYSFSSRREGALPKGQTRAFEGVFYVPRESREGKQFTLRTQVNPTQGSYDSPYFPGALSPLNEWESLFVVLSLNPSEFASWEQTQTCMPRVDAEAQEPAIQYYQLLLPRIEKRIPLPDHSLTWSSIAYILWDDVSLEASPLTQTQQESFLDWLHFGGQVIVNGPHAWEQLRESFLAPHLPVTDAKAKKLGKADFAELDAYWSIESKKKVSKSAHLVISEKAEFLGLDVTLRDDARFMPHTGKLVAERNVGRGRIVFTSFPVSTPTIVNWTNFDGFLNGCLLARPARTFRKLDEFGGGTCTWADPRLAMFRRDSRPLSTLRYFSRDAGYPADLTPVVPFRKSYMSGPNNNVYDATQELASSDPRVVGLRTSSGMEHPTEIVTPHFDGHQSLPGSGTGAWNDHSGAMTAGREQLRDAAGIEIPKASFVLSVLAGYLFILVPLNWTIFRLINRVEWAWIAAPVIAIAGTIAVVRLAQLDIGFVRSRTELDLVELHAGYSRGHVTRLSALYSSLSAGYRIEYENPHTFALPVLVGKERIRSQDTVLGGTRNLLHTLGKRFQIDGFNVASNKAEELHIEQMHDFGGVIELQGSDAQTWKLRNGTKLDLRDVGVLYLRDSNTLETAYFAGLAAETTRPLRFEEANAREPWVKEWSDSPIFAQPKPDEKTKGDLRAWRLAQVGVQALKMRPGEMRLIAHCGEEIPGIDYVPHEDQKSTLSFVIVHLKRGALPAPERDVNSLLDINVIESGRTITPDSLPGVAPEIAP